MATAELGISFERPPVGQPLRWLESTAVLFHRIRSGDEQAREKLFARYLPTLRRWAHGRLPARARDLAETDDLVQVTFIRALNHVDRFEPRRKGAFLAYLWRILLNTVREEIRRSARRARAEALGTGPPDPKRSVLEQTIGREALESYESALIELPEEQREAVMLRIEFGFTHQEIAEALGKPSSDAARMCVARALVRLAELMNE